MQLIGMLDSPYVRRVAISLQYLDLPFKHRPVSVFSTFDQFQQINPVVKAPTLVCDDGALLMDSTLILHYAEALATPCKSLMPSDFPQLQRELRIIGLALAACEKSIQIVYERTLQPAEKWHDPWISRVTGQLVSASEALELELSQQRLSANGNVLSQAGITTAVAWTFIQNMVPEAITASEFNALQDFTGYAETLDAFVAAPFGGDIVEVRC